MQTENNLKVVSIRLVDEPPIYSESKIDTPKKVAELLMEEFRTLDREVFCVLNMKTNMQVINFNVVSMGSLNCCVFHPREIFKSSILANAGGVILVHNHPSGDCTPSKDDMQATKRLVDCGQLIGIEVLDHIIIGKNQFLSMQEEGMLPSCSKEYGQIAAETNSYHVQKKPSISFYVAECMEFPSMGNVYENLSLEQAVKKYRQIPDYKQNMGNGIGFSIENAEDSCYNGAFELMSFNRLDLEMLYLIPYYRDSPLVHKAVEDIRKLMPELEVIEDRGGPVIPEIKGREKKR
ncbi:JAB domain-containing protein [[Clostridium] symbiosum]|uniref:JAB domain-containing protein n=1 Tax=Clostridium symbiosum TaxID=1512 RepID=UPI001AA15BCD|nr:JAB domain-containing protein [[Clostridium] symbiosum]